MNFDLSNLPDPDTLDVPSLRALLAKLNDFYDELEGCEPDEEDVEEYDAWLEDMEETESMMEDIQERLDRLS